jgi:hypothetical protein
MFFGEAGAHHGSSAPANAGNPGGDFMMQMGMQYGQRMWSEGERSVSRWLPTTELRKRFHVSHAYVRSKLAMLAVPVAKSFERRRADFSEDRSGAAFFAPVDDVCSADLYIPSMAVISYVTFFAFAVGLRDQAVDSQDLGATATFAAVSIALEALAVNIWRYVVGLVSASFLDLIAVFGYGYVSISLAVLLGTIGLSNSLWGWRVVIFLLSVNFAVFVYKSLAELFAKDGVVPKRALPIIYGCCALQLPLFLFAAARPFL